ncbi:MAG: MBL fold metallo-hydrolase [Anaerolineae bacterium]
MACPQPDYMKHILVVNGLEAPFLRQFGCDCARCADPTPQANTSMSLITLDAQGETAYHILFDIGMGVSESLVRCRYLAGLKARLDWIILSHWHPDHTVGLNQLVASYQLNRRRRGEETPPVPLWCRSGTAAWMQAGHPFEWETFLSPYLSDENQPPGTLLAPVPVQLSGVTITPVAVSHYSADRWPNGRGGPCFACAAFVIQTRTSKNVLLWDIDSENEWLVRPKTAEQTAAVALFAGADTLFIDTAFWRAREGRTSHPGFPNVQRYVRSLRPQHTLLMHLSGHPDGRGNPGWGWSNRQWQEEAGRVWREQGLPGQVSVPAIGEEFEIGK